MSTRAWVYIGAVILAAAALGGLNPPPALPSSAQWLTFGILVALASLAQLFEVEATNRQSYYPAMVFFFAGVLLLPPWLFVLLVTIPHLVEWLKERAIDRRRRPWYIQPFNIATHILAALAAHGVHWLLDVDHGLFIKPLSVAAVMLGAMTYVMVNHLLIGQVLVLARGIGWGESGVLALENLLADLIMMLLGYIVAVLWQLNPWMIVPALSPLVLMYRALAVPRLKQEAQTDAKTGLWNARHFGKLFAAEFERARRFSRPLALIVADLDLLRNINNTYGHLAGDAVLAGIGQIIPRIVREYDIAGRFGGEEFVIALPETEPAEALVVAERLRQAVETAAFTVSTSPTPIGVTMSLGVACFPIDATAPDHLLHEADIAVYQAKLQGRNRVVSAAEVPSHVKTKPLAGGHHSLIAQVPAEPAAPPPAPAPTPTPPADAGDAGRPAADAPAAPAGPWLALFVGAVIVVGVGATLLGLRLWPQPYPDLAAIALLTLLTLLTERFQIDVYGDNTVSVSVALAIAAALIGGMPGVVAVSAAIALVHFVQRRPPLYKTAFNLAVHLLAGLAPVLAITLLPVPLQIGNLLPLAGLVASATLAYYLIETGLIATALSLAHGARLIAKWRAQFQWLTSHYLALGILALFVALAHAALGWPGILVFMLPVFMMRSAQQQYVERTERSVRELKRLNAELTEANRDALATGAMIRQLNDELLLTLAKVVDARDPYVASHATKVADYAVAIGAELGLPAERLAPLRQAALLHDIGKLAIAEQVLHKPGTLTDDEYIYLQSHAALGGEFLMPCQGLRHLAPFVRHHHERWDGRGYPDGLAGEAIPLEARIIGVCDAVEAMASDRSYHRALAAPEVIAEVRRCAGTQFDPTVAEAFLRIIEREGKHLITNSALRVHRQSPGQEASAPAAGDRLVRAR